MPLSFESSPFPQQFGHSKALVFTAYTSTKRYPSSAALRTSSAGFGKSAGWSKSAIFRSKVVYSSASFDAEALSGCGVEEKASGDGDGRDGPGDVVDGATSGALERRPTTDASRFHKSRMLTKASVHIGFARRHFRN